MQPRLPWKRLRWLESCLGLALLSGCLPVETTKEFRFQPDGSGTLFYDIQTNLADLAAKLKRGGVPPEDLTREMGAVLEEEFRSVEEGMGLLAKNLPPYAHLEEFTRDDFKHWVISVEFSDFNQLQERLKIFGEGNKDNFIDAYEFTTGEDECRFYAEVWGLGPLNKVTYRVKMPGRITATSKNARIERSDDGDTAVWTAGLGRLEIVATAQPRTSSPGTNPQPATEGSSQYVFSVEWQQQPYEVRLTFPQPTKQPLVAMYGYQDITVDHLPRVQITSQGKLVTDKIRRTAILERLPHLDFHLGSDSLLPSPQIDDLKRQQMYDMSALFVPENIFEHLAKSEAERYLRALSRALAPQHLPIAWSQDVERAHGLVKDMGGLRNALKEIGEGLQVIRYGPINKLPRHLQLRQRISDHCLDLAESLEVVGTKVRIKGVDLEFNVPLEFLDVLLQTAVEVIRLLAAQEVLIEHLDAAIRYDLTHERRLSPELVEASRILSEGIQQKSDLVMKTFFATVGDLLWRKGFKAVREIATEGARHLASRWDKIATQHGWYWAQGTSAALDRACLITAGYSISSWIYGFGDMHEAAMGAIYADRCTLEFGLLTGSLMGRYRRANTPAEREDILTALIAARGLESYCAAAFYTFDAGFFENGRGIEWIADKISGGDIARAIEDSKNQAQTIQQQVGNWLWPPVVEKLMSSPANWQE